MVTTTRNARKRALEDVTSRIPDKTLTTVAKCAYNEILSAIELSRQYRDAVETKRRKDAPYKRLIETYKAQSSQVHDKLYSYESMYEYLWYSTAGYEGFEKTQRVRHLMSRTRNWLQLLDKEVDDLVDAMGADDAKISKMQDATVEQARKAIGVFENALEENRVLEAHKREYRKRGREPAGTPTAANDRDEGGERPVKRQRLLTLTNPTEKPVLKKELLNSNISTISRITPFEIPSPLPSPPAKAIFKEVARRPVRTCTDDSVSFKDGLPDLKCTSKEREAKIKEAFETLQRCREDMQKTNSRQAKEDLRRAIRIARRWRLPVNKRGFITVTADIDPDILSYEGDSVDFTEGSTYGRIVNWLPDPKNIPAPEEDILEEEDADEVRPTSPSSTDISEYRAHESDGSVHSDRRACDHSSSG